MHFSILAHKTLKTHYIKGAKNQIIFLSHFIAAGSWMVNTHTHTHTDIYIESFFIVLASRGQNVSSLGDRQY